MTSKKFAKLIMCTGQNNNKYYIMEWDGVSSNFNVKYGRVESTEAHASYPISKWDSQYNSKVKKGYKDITHTVSVTIDTTEDKGQEDETLAEIEERKVAEFLTLMKRYTDGLVAKTYTVKYQDVTQAQVDEAQNIIDELQKIDKNDVTSFNSKLLELYMIIPRYMGNVRDHLIPNINVEKTLQQEQDNLDAMASQVKMYKKDTKKKKEPTKAEKAKQNSLLDLLGIKKMTQVKSNPEIDYLVKQISGRKVESIFEVQKDWEDKRFADWLASQPNKQTKLVYHGTKCTSVIPILEQGLKIRPTGKFQFSGKAYGNGNYFSEQFNTSIGYTDGHRGDSVMLIYEVHIGKESTSCFNDYNSCKRAGYDSFNGGWLRVAYKEEQCRIKYIVWLK